MYIILCLAEISRYKEMYKFLVLLVFGCFWFSLQFWGKPKKYRNIYLFLVRFSRKCREYIRQRSVFLGLSNLRLIQIVFIRVSASENQYQITYAKTSSLCARSAAELELLLSLLPESSEWRDARTGAHHDDWLGDIFRKMKRVGSVKENRTERGN